MENLKRISRTVVLFFLVAGLPVAATELDGPATIVSDAFGVPTIIAETEHDAIYLEGYLHARDRLFQMDVQRRLFSGRVAELLGPAAIPQDVQLRTLGLRRAAERSLAVQTPEVLAWLQAYSDGVNAFLNDTSKPLPFEYTLGLEIDRGGIPPWTPTDSLVVAKGLAFGLSFSLGDIDRTLAVLTFRGVCTLIGCNGLQLFNDDLYRAAPFEPQASIPPPFLGSVDPADQTPEDETPPAFLDDPAFAALVQGYRDTISEIPLLKNALEFESSTRGSNWWLTAGSRTDSGFPMLANDPHLSLGSPATFYEVHLSVEGGINVTGTSFPGAPGVVLGCNDTVCWGATNNAQDVTDVYNEVLLALNPALPTTPTHIYRADGPPEPLQFIPQTYMVNIIGDGVFNSLVNANVPPTSGGVTMVVPRRNNGPIVNVSFDPTSPTPLTGLSVAYTGWSATRELETFRRFARATSMQEFKEALQYFDVGSQNWAYADINGNIAYYTSGELPIREDLQLLWFPAGLQPPYLIRDGTHTNRHDWLPLMNPQPQQALGTEILPFNEMPQIENPAAGYILNANNDPIGTTFNNVSWDQLRANFNGLLYLAPGYAAGFRMGRLQRLFNAQFAGDGTLSLADYVAIQGNNQMLDAEVLTPYLFAAFANATAAGAPAPLAALGADPRVAEAIARLGAWDFSTPTGINEGFDPGDNPAAPGPPSAAEVDNSVAATIYAMWRGQVVQRVIDSTLRNLPIPLDAYTPPSDLAMSALRRLLANYPINGGTGASLLNFFQVPGIVDPFVARDVILLESLLNGLNLLASDQFAPAFGNSTNLAEYRWGKLHRIVFKSYLGGPFNIPPTGSSLNLAPELPGIARAGGMGVLDASSHSVRADGLQEFMFDSGPSRRVIATMTPAGPQVLQVIPGGESGNAGNPHQTDQLPLWLVNAYKPLPVSLDDVYDTAVETVTLVCGDGDVDPGEQCDDGNSNEGDGCTTACRIAPVITCLSPSLPADADTCTASVACDAVATCVDPVTGAAVAATCVPEGSFGAGVTDVTVQCSDGQDLAVGVCTATVLDVTAPTISFSTAPSELWPPNHHMVDVQATIVADDTCGAPAVTLVSIESDEPDDAPGTGDGSTVNDIVIVDGTSFQLRSERAGTGDGRVYTVTYVAADAEGNETEATATVFVPHDRGTMVDPLSLRLAKTGRGTQLSWGEVVEASYYNVIRSSLEQLKETAETYSLGAVTCIQGATPTFDTRGHEDAEVPEPGGMFVYVVEFYDGTTRSTYGTESAAKPRLPRVGDCE